MNEALSELWREVFEGVTPGESGTWFVQGSEAILPSLEGLSPEQASALLPGQRATVGAHARHLGYYLELFNANNRGEQPKTDWEGSWAVQTFNEEEWSALLRHLRAEYVVGAGYYQRGVDQADAIATTYALSNLAHAAFHLGAIRALMPLVAQ